MCLKGFGQSQALGEFLQRHQGTLSPCRAGACAALRRDALLPAYRVGQHGAKLACADDLEPTTADFESAMACPDRICVCGNFHGDHGIGGQRRGRRSSWRPSAASAQRTRACSPRSKRPHRSQRPLRRSWQTRLLARSGGSCTRGRPPAVMSCVRLLRAAPPGLALSRLPAAFWASLRHGDKKPRRKPWPFSVPEPG